MDALTPTRLAAHLRGRTLWRTDLDLPPRPPGHVVWVHAGDPLPTAPLADLCERLEARLGEVTLLRTDTGQADPDPCIAHVPLPMDPRALYTVMQQWRPAAALWSGALNAPLLIDTLSQANVPLHLVNALPPQTTNRRARRVERLLLDRFRIILARDAETAAAFGDVGVTGAQVEVAGAFVGVPAPLPCSETDREDLTKGIGSRPVWLASHVPPDELAAVLNAHGQALRSAHRLLLILVPAQESDGAQLAERLTADGWTVSRNGAGEIPKSDAEIFVADSHEEMGLWYRAAPLCYLGGSLSAGLSVNPLEPAALGAGLIVGPGFGDHTEILERMDRASALRRVSGATGLARAVADLISPDRVATLAHRAWDIATDGADVGERLAQHLAEAIARPSP